MTQTDRIHALGYLIAHEINLENLKEDKNNIFLMREGSEILSASIEVIEKADAGTIDVGFDFASDFLLNDIDLSAEAVHKSRVETRLKQDAMLTIETSARKGKIKVRVLYFTSGTIYS